MFYVIYPLLWLLSLLPLKVLYAFSTPLYFLIYRVVGYRKKVVRQNCKIHFELGIPKKKNRKRIFIAFC